MSIKKSYSESELNSLMADVAKEFSTHIAKAEETLGLKKSEDDQPDQKKVNGAADDKKNSAKDEKTSAMENKDGGKSDDKRNAAADESQSQGDRSKEAAEDKSGKPIEGEKAGDKGVDDQHQQQDGAKEGQADMGHNYDDEDMQHMHSMYSSMSPGELKAHHDSIRKCMDGHGLAKCEGGMMKAEMEDGAKDSQGYRPNGGPKDGKAENECKAAAPTDTQALNKSESTQIDLMKSELQIAKAETEKSKKEVAAVTDFLKKFVEKTAPAGKAITSLDIIAKTEGSTEEKPLQKSEIDARLTAKARELTLSKSDREAINSYYCGSKDIKKVSHLLK
jgi:hypothetical protein